jgi:hypothetical protein
VSQELTPKELRDMSSRLKQAAAVTDARVKSLLAQAALILAQVAEELDRRAGGAGS